MAWVDYDSKAARQGVARFAQVLREQHFDDSRPVELQLVGTDVTNPDHLTTAMKRLIAAHPSLIVASSVTVARCLLDLHTDIPMHFVIQSDPMRDGLVPSLIPSGSLTGYTYFLPLDVKIVELLTRVFPARHNVGVLADPVWMNGWMRSPDLEPQARALGLNLQIFELSAPQDLERVLKEARDVQVWYVPYTVLMYTHGSEIAAALSRTGTPAVYARRKFLEQGGVISVQSVDSDALQVWAQTIARILNGMPAGSIPVMRPKEIEVAVNAKALSHLDTATRERAVREATVFD